MVLTRRVSDGKRSRRVAATVVVVFVADRHDDEEDITTQERYSWVSGEIRVEKLVCGRDAEWVRGKQGKISEFDNSRAFILQIQVRSTAVPGVNKVGGMTKSTQHSLP